MSAAAMQSTTLGRHFSSPPIMSATPNTNKETTLSSSRHTAEVTTASYTILFQQSLGKYDHHKDEQFDSSQSLALRSPMPKLRKEKSVEILITPVDLAHHTKPVALCTASTSHVQVSDGTPMAIEIDTPSPELQEESGPWCEEEVVVTAYYDSASETADETGEDDLEVMDDSNYRKPSHTGLLSKLSALKKSYVTRKAEKKQQKILMRIDQRDSYVLQAARDKQIGFLKLKNSKDFSTTNSTRDEYIPVLLTVAEDESSSGRREVLTPVAGLPRSAFREDPECEELVKRRLLHHKKQIRAFQLYRLKCELNSKQ